MTKLIMCKGLPGSGKSTWAQSEVDNGNKGVVRVNKDEIRARDKKTWTHDVEKEVLRVRDKEISEGLSSGKVVISDDTNFAQKHEMRLRELAKKYKATFIINESFLEVSLEECILRDSLRDEYDRVGEKVIRDMYERYLLAPKKVVPKEMVIERVTKQLHLPSAVICDLDGTASLSEGLRGPYEHEKAANDHVNTPILNILLMASNAGYEVLYVSGREEKFRTESAQFLSNNGFPKGSLDMRPTGDKRNDAIVKLEIFNKVIRDKFNIEFVLDDRDRVVKMWRDLGLTCLQVNYGDF